MLIPETELPWEHDGSSDISFIRSTSAENVAEVWLSKDSKYIEHACNAYPKLVGFLKAALNKEGFGQFFVPQDVERLLKELGEIASN